MGRTCWMSWPWERNWRGITRTRPDTDDQIGLRGMYWDYPVTYCSMEADLMSITVSVLERTYSNFTAVICFLHGMWTDTGYRVPRKKTRLQLNQFSATRHCSKM